LPNARDIKRGRGEQELTGDGTTRRGEKNGLASPKGERTETTEREGKSYRHYKEEKTGKKFKRPIIPEQGRRKDLG